MARTAVILDMDYLPGVASSDEASSTMTPKEVSRYT
jgi:hypothetical protein